MSHLTIRNTRAAFRTVGLWHLVIFSTMFLLVEFIAGKELPWWWLLLVYYPAPFMAWNLSRLTIAVVRTTGSVSQAWESYRSGLSVRDVRWVAEQMQTYDQIKARAAAETPEILGRVEQLLKEHKLMLAAEAIDTQLLRRKREDERRARQVAKQRAQGDELLVRAEKAGYVELIRSLVEAGNLAAAEEKLGRCHGWLTKARVLGVENEMRQALSSCTNGFDAAEQLIRDVQVQREHERTMSDLVTRVRRVPSKDHQRLNEMLLRLQELPCGSRQFRKEHHELEQALQGAEGTR